MNPTLSNPQQPAAAQPAPAPWWKFGHVWLVVAGPVAVIIAGVATAWIAVSSPDPVIAEDYYRQGIEINRTLEAREAERSLTPAQRARNHAATPTVDMPEAAR